MGEAALYKVLGKIFPEALQRGDIDLLLQAVAEHLGLHLTWVETASGEGMLFPVEDSEGHRMGYLQAMPRDRAIEHAESLRFIAYLAEGIQKYKEQAGVLQSSQILSQGLLTGNAEALGAFLETLRRQIGADALILCEKLDNRYRILAGSGGLPPREELVEDALDRIPYGHREVIEIPSQHPLLHLSDYHRAWQIPLLDPENQMLGALIILSRERYSALDFTVIEPWRSFLLLGLDRRRWARFLRNAWGSVVLSMVALEEMRDPYTRGHSERVARLATQISRKLGFPPSRIEKIHFAALLHDIGKVAIPDILLLKPTGLQEHEIEIVRAHVRLGYEILRHIEAFQDVAQWILAHHERWDGTGYPQGLKGNEIPIEAQIISVADVFDALTSTRPYRRGFSVEKALEIIQEESGKAFNPEVVTASLDILKEMGKPIREKTPPLLYVYLDRVRKESALSFAEIGVLMNAILQFWSESPLDSILQDVVETTIRIFHFDGGFFREIKENQVVLKAHYGVPEKYVQTHRHVPFAPFQGWAEWAVQEGYLYFEDINKSPMIRRFFRRLIEEGAVSVLIIPLYARHRKERIHGYLAFFNCHPREIPAEQIRLLSQIGRHLGLLMDYREREEQEHLYQRTLLEVLDILRGGRHRGRINLRKVVRFLGEQVGLPTDRLRALEMLVSFVDMDHFLAPDLLRLKLLHGMALTEEEQEFLDRLESEVRMLVSRLHLPEDWREILQEVFEGNPIKVESKILYTVRLYRKYGEHLQKVEEAVGDVIPVKLFQNFQKALEWFEEPPEESRAALYEDLYAFLREISVIYEIGAHLESVTDVQVFARKVLESLARVTGFDSLFLLARHNQTQRVLATWGFPEEVLGQTIPEGEGLVGRAVRTGQTVLVQNTADDPEYIPPAGKKMGSALVVPLKLRDRIVGVLAVENRAPETFSLQHVRFLNLVSRYIAPVVYLLTEEMDNPLSS